MGYILCTTEKPSVAKEIAHVIGADKKCDGYFEGNGYRVTWAVGHLVGLAEPEEYGYMSQSDIWDKEHQENKNKALSELPLIPDEFKLIVLPKTRPQFNVIKKLMNDPECNMIIDCGDAGEEGHILQDFIRRVAGCHKPVKRFMATSMTEEAIKAAMNNLQDINKYKPIIVGAFCKKKADWILGMSMSRCASITYQAKVDVGRVQSPTLYFVVQRFLAYMNFKPQTYYQMQVDFKEGFSAFWKKDNTGLFNPEDVDVEHRVVNKSAIKTKLNEISERTGIIKKIESKNKTTERPQLYDVTELEREGNRIYGYTAEEVLKTAQSLYETHKITTYPRTDSRYITSDLAPLMQEKIEMLLNIKDYHDAAAVVLKNGLNLDKKVVDDTKVTDHHAIIITDNFAKYDLSKLNERERNILDLICKRMIVTMSTKYEYKETMVEVYFNNGFVFGAKGHTPFNHGWKDVQRLLSSKNNDEESPHGEDFCEENQIFKNIKEGQIVNIQHSCILEKETTRPKLHTEGTLLTAMENAGANIKGGEILKGRGIGTPATRAAIIKSIFDKGYVTTKQTGKVKYIIPTKQGMSVIKVLPKELYSPMITADWENKIALIVEGKIDENMFMDEFKKFILGKISEVKNNKIEGVDFSFDKELMGKCPWCKSDVYLGKYKDKQNNVIESAYCSNKECKFSIRRDDLIFKSKTKKNFTIKQMKDLIAAGHLECKCISKSEATYTGMFTIEKNDMGYAKITWSFPQTKKKKFKLK